MARKSTAKQKEDVLTQYLKRSSFLVHLNLEGTDVVYNSFYGTPILLDKNALQLLDLFTTPNTLQSLLQTYDVDDAERWIRFFKRNYLLVEATVDERALVNNEVQRAVGILQSGKKLESLGLIMDEACNFSCTYCISKKMIHATRRSNGFPTRMTWRVAREAIDRFTQLLRDRGATQAEIYFGGSEPLLNWDLIVKTIRYCDERYGTEFSFRYSTNTNASLITPARARYLARHNVTVTTSLDGDQRSNDAVRITTTGEGTYASILKGWRCLQQASIGPTWFCLTLTDANMHLINERFFHTIKELGITSCSIEPDLINPLKTDPEVVVKKLLAFKSIAEHMGILVGGMWEKPYKNLYIPNIRKRIFNCSAFTGRGISVLPDGRIVPCSYSASVIGHIRTLSETFKSQPFTQLSMSRATGAIPACHGCELEGRCMGGCYITPEYGDARGSRSGFDYRCKIYKIATRSLLQATVGTADTQSRKEV